MTDPYTTATLERPVRSRGAAPLGGDRRRSRCSGSYFHLTLGAGYGYYFVPGLDIANTKKTFVPDAIVAVVL